MANRKVETLTKDICECLGGTWDEDFKSCRDRRVLHEQILRHLSKFVVSPEQIEFAASRRLTQEGIAGILGVSRCSVAIALAELQEADLVESKLRHPIPDGRRVLTYTITPHGMLCAKM